MLPYLIAGAIGFAVAKLFEEDETPKYSDGGYIKNIKKLYEEDGSEVYGGDFGEAGGLNWRINKEQDYLYLMGIGRNKKTGSNEGESKGEGSRAIAYLFNLYPKVDVIYFEIDGEEGAWQFYKKIGAEEEGGGEIAEHTYNAQITRESIKKYFKNKDISFSFNYGGSVLLAPNGKPSNLTPEQYKLVRTKAFKQWFGDWEKDPANASKVVDENGEPLVCNHSSREKDIDIFYGGRIFRTKSNEVKPIWFTYKKGNVYAEDEDIFQYHAFLNIRNLFDYSNQKDVSELSDYFFQNNDKKMPDYDFDMDWEAQEQFNLPAYIYEMDYDGYKFTDEYSIVIFNSNQIKLADGTNTTFDGNNTDIRFDDGGKLADNIFDYFIEIKGLKPLGNQLWEKSNCTIKMDFSNVLNLDKHNRVWLSPIEYNDYKKAFTILEFHCRDKNKGVGTSVLKEIIQGADLFGYTIFIEPTSMKKYRVETDINTDDLKRWYSKYDFKPINDNYSDYVWLRSPKNPNIRFDGGGMSYREYADTQFNEEEDRYLPSDYFDDLEIKKLSKENLPLIKIKDGLEYRKWGDSFIKVFDNDYRVGFADTKAIQVAKEYQKKGIGLELVTLLKEMNPNHRFGSMTPQGFNLMGKYYDTKIANNPDIRFDDGGIVQPKDLTKINNFKNIQIGVDYYAYSDDIEKQNKSDRWYELFVKNQKYEKITPEEFKEFILLSNELTWEDLG